MKAIKLLAITLLACLSFTLANAQPAQPHKKHAQSHAHRKANRRHRRKIRHLRRKAKHHHKASHRVAPQPKK